MILQEQYAHTAQASFKASSPASHLIGCPICGRPSKIRQQLIGQEVACSHCHGTFVVTKNFEGSLTASSTTTAVQAETRHSSHRSASLLPTHQQNGLLRPIRHDQKAKRQAAIVDKPHHEDYARLADDLIAAGYRVVRAVPPSDARRSGSTTSAGNKTTLERLFLHAEDFQYFTDSFAYQRRVSTASLAISHPPMNWLGMAIKSRASEPTNGSKLNADCASM